MSIPIPTWLWQELFGGFGPLPASVITDAIPALVPEAEPAPPHTDDGADA